MEFKLTDETQGKANDLSDESICYNGPMMGHTLKFGDSSCTSAIFTYRGATGRYIKGDWVSA
jgi:hypothetical protein